MDGDRGAFEMLAARSLPRLVGSAGFMLDSREAAEDATQDALIRAWRDLPTLRDPDRFQAWMYRLLVNACHDHRRRDAAYRRALGEAPRSVVGDPAEPIAQQAAIRAGLAKLTPEHRAVLVLRYYGDLTQDEIAEALSLPTGTVKSRLHRALAAMQAAMAAEARGVAGERPA